MIWPAFSSKSARGNRTLSQNFALAMGIRIQKDRTPVVVMTERYRIEAELHVVVGGRLIDEINKERNFIPLTNVTIYDLAKGKAIETVEFLAINKDSVLFFAPIGPSNPEGYGL